MSGRQWLIETHSDHLIRRLRRLTAASPSGSNLETWLCSNVSITSVTQKGGRSFVNTSCLSSSGEGSSEWPEEFMDQATREEDSIYLARLSKNPSVSEFAALDIEHRPHDEEDEYPQ
jgi:predicted ATPase